ncbi:MAG TPA: saccharopine dehydrogenase NADP-binding domain-containing protein [Chitinophagales bacterium]|nr:saccharopine dehydrogenase NADP-binding domain-containing protein [Chitinophagales bacterium]
MKEGFIIYGCNGYTGKLISEHAAALGLKPVLAGRDAQKVKELAQKLQLDYRVFGLDDPKQVAAQIAPFKVVLHCAGPFIYTSKIMAQACLEAGTHYLDITGEYQVFEYIFGLNTAAEKAGIMLMAGTGFDVVPSDCLAAYLAEQLPGADKLELALYMKGGRISHGTAITVTENLGQKTLIRKNGSLVEIPNGKLTKQIEIDGSRRTGVAISWGDISTAYRSTGIKNITVYNVLPKKVIDSMKMSNYLGFFFRLGFVKNYLKKQIKKRPAGPTDAERQKARSMVWGTVTGKNGTRKSAYVDLPEGYTLTALTAVKIVQNILQNQPPAGAKTPSQVYGANFILEFETVKRCDL